MIEDFFGFNSYFYQFILRHQRSLLVGVLILILVSTWYVFYGVRGKIGNKIIFISHLILGIITMYGGWKVYNEYHQLPLYLLDVVFPYAIVIFTSMIRIRLNIAMAVVRPMLLMAYFLSAIWYSFYMLSLLTPLFAMVCY